MSSANGRPDILTYSGKYFDYLEPERNEYDIYDIAHHLSNLCRFAGAVRSFYSVAQHCDLVSRLVPPRQALPALLHDGAEFVLVDIPRPLKQLLPDYKKIEARVERDLMTRFDLPYPMSAEVHDADRLALFIEQRDLMPAHEDYWAVFEGLDLSQIQNFPKIVPLLPQEAEQAFLARYRVLMTESV